MTRFMDLHTHTTASDGSYSPTQVVQMAEKKQLAAVAITDHDTTDGVLEALAAGEQLAVEVIPGVEVSVNHARLGSLHMLGYFIDPAHPDLAERLADIRDGREKRNQKILAQLASLDCPLQFEEVLKIAGGEVIGRPHLAQALLNRGYVESTRQAFDRYLARGKPAYMERERMSPEEAIDRIRRAGGVAVWAHPGLRRFEDLELEQELIKLVDAGLSGVEVYYPEHTPETTALLENLADKHNLARTGGTDFHGEVKPDVTLGSLPVPAPLLEELKFRRP